MLILEKITPEHSELIKQNTIYYFRGFSIITLHTEKEYLLEIEHNRFTEGIIEVIFFLLKRKWDK